MKSAALVTNVLSHYRIPCFRELDRQSGGAVRFYLLSGGMGHRGYVMGDGEPGLPATRLRGFAWKRPPRDDRHLNDILPVVRGGYDTLILGGWDEPTYLALWMWAVATRRKVLFWVESTAREGARRGIRERVKRLLLRHSSGCIVPGKRSAEYVASLGLPGERIRVAPNAADRAHFSSRARGLLPRREELRKDLGIAGGPLFLFVGRLEERYKDVSSLVRAFAKTSRVHGDATLLIAGDGSSREALERLGASSPGHVRFLGEQGREDVCRLYAAADVLVLPSRSETWGVVLNEAMEFGLPLVVSDAVGAGPDLVEEGRNGFVFPVGDAEALAGIMEILAVDPMLRARMGAESRRIVERFSPEAWAAGVMGALESVG